MDSLSVTNSLSYSLEDVASFYDFAYFLSATHERPRGHANGSGEELSFSLLTQMLTKGWEAILPVTLLVSFSWNAIWEPVVPAYVFTQ